MDVRDARGSGTREDRSVGIGGGGGDWGGTHAAIGPGVQG